MRCGVVAGFTRNADAISSVVSPQTSRSVVVICASGPREGWQQVNMSRRRSSCSAGASTSVCIGASSGRRELALRAIEACASAQAAQRHERTGCDEPCPRVLRLAVARQLRGRGEEGVVQRLIGEVEIPKQAEQRGEYAARLGAIERPELGHCPSPSWIGMS